MTVRSTKRSSRFALVSIPLLFVAIALLQERIDARTRSAAQAREELLFRSGPALKKLSLGYDSLLANIYWTRAVQHYGSEVGFEGSRFELLWPLLDLTTTLDPRLIVAYRFGAIFLSEPPPIGPGRVDLAVDLVKRGIAANPNDWQLGTDLGFLYFWHLHQYNDASLAYMQASKIPGAPEWVRIMAARVADKGGALETSQLMWSEIYQTTKDPKIRKQALEHLAGLKALEDERKLDQFAEEYKKRAGRYPASIKELVDAGDLKGVPLDPAGFPYEFGSDGKAQLNPKSPVTIEAPPNLP